MNASDLAQRIEEWIRLSFLLPAADDRDHCHGLRRNFALAGGPTLDFLSFRHQEPAAHGAPDVFSVSLWKCVHGAVTSQTVRDMGLSLLLVRAAYAQLLEEAQCRGWQRRHRFNVQGHILGARFERNSLIDTLSGGGGEVVFWTFAWEEGRLIVDPYYIDGGADRASEPLEQILDHLAWKKSEKKRPSAGPPLITPTDALIH